MLSWVSEALGGWADYGSAALQRGYGLLPSSSPPTAEDEAERDRTHRETLDRARGEDFRDLEELGFVDAAQRARGGRRALVVHGNRIPMRVLDRCGSLSLSLCPSAMVDSD